MQETLAKIDFHCKRLESPMTMCTNFLRIDNLWLTAPVIFETIASFSSDCWRMLYIIIMIFLTELSQFLQIFVRLEAIFKIDWSGGQLQPEALVIFNIIWTIYTFSEDEQYNAGLRQILMPFNYSSGFWLVIKLLNFENAVKNNQNNKFK